MIGAYLSLACFGLAAVLAVVGFAFILTLIVSPHA